jgi:phage baseplate assembly protein W
MAKVLSTEDGDLTGKSIRTSRTTDYIDIDLSFAKNTSTGDIFKKKDASAVKQSISNLLQTNRFEKPFSPEFGGNILGQIFELAVSDTGIEIEDQIRTTIARYEPRAKILSLNVISNVDQNSLFVQLEFQVVNTSEIVSFETTLSRLR